MVVCPASREQTTLTSSWPPFPSWTSCGVFVSWIQCRHFDETAVTYAFCGYSHYGEVNTTIPIDFRRRQRFNTRGKNVEILSPPGFPPQVVVVTIIATKQLFELCASFRRRVAFFFIRNSLIFIHLQKKASSQVFVVDFCQIFTGLPFLMSKFSEVPEVRFSSRLPL